MAAQSGIHFLGGDLQSAEVFAREGLELLQKINSPWIEALVWMTVGKVLGKANPQGIDDAVAHVRKAIGMCEEMEMKPWSAMGYGSLGELYAGADQRENALENLKKAEGMYREMGLDSRSYWTARTQELLGRL